MKTEFALVIIAMIIVPLFTAKAMAAQQSLIDISTTYISSSKADEAGNETKVSQQITTIKGTMPMRLNGKNILMISPTYQHHELKWKNFQTISGITESDLPDILHSAELAVGLVHRLSPKWSVMGRISGGVKSDYDDIDSRDVIYGGLVSLTRNFDRKNNIGLGVTYSDSFGSPFFFPLLMFKWAPTDNLFFHGTLPVQLTGGYKHSDKFSLGFNVEVKGNQYRLTEKMPWNESVLNYSEILMGPFVDFAVTEKVRLMLRCGIVTGQKMEFKDKYDTEKILAEKDLEDSTFATISVYVPF